MADFFMVARRWWATCQKRGNNFFCGFDWIIGFFWTQVCRPHTRAVVACTYPGMSRGEPAMFSLSLVFLVFWWATTKNAEHQVLDVVKGFQPSHELFSVFHASILTNTAS